MDLKKVFITRDLNPADFFYKSLITHGFEVMGESLIDFSIIPFDDIPKVDWIFFYSKKAVSFFHEGLVNKELELAEGVKFAAFGKGTAQKVEDLFEKVDYIGSGKAESTAKAFATIAKGQSVLFPRARNSRKSVQQLIEEEVSIHDLIIYSNIAKPKIYCSTAKVLVFTSPMNAQNYHRNCNLYKYQILIAIGESTKKTLVSFGLNSVITPGESTEKALVDLILTLVDA